MVQNSGDDRRTPEKDHLAEGEQQLIDFARKTVT
jgi:hypothetical protein